MKKITSICLLFCLSILCNESASANIMSWGIHGSGDAPSFVNEVRLGCPENPEYCIEKIKAYPEGRFKKISLAIHWKSLTVAEIKNNIDDYQRLIEQKKYKHVELSIDDFSTLLKKYGDSQTADILKKLGNVHRSSSKLKTGLTIYEDDIAAVQKSTSTTEAIAANIDRIVLFLHFRKNFINIEDYVKKIKAITPSDIYLGVYHYDRTKNISCAEFDTKKCSDQEDFELFKDAFSKQKKMLNDGQVVGLEFYPGNIGKESSWAGWKNERICDKDHLNKCISNSTEMGELIKKSQEK